MNKKIARSLSVFFRYCLYFLLFISGPTFASEKIVLQLQWLHQFQFAGYYAALEQGYFAEEVLEGGVLRFNLEDRINRLINGDVLFTTSQEAENHPERVVAMRRAVLRGWEYALENKEETIGLILKNPTHKIKPMTY